MGAFDLNINESGDIELNNNGDICTKTNINFETSILVMKSMIQKIFFFNNELSNKFIGRKITLGLDEEIEEFIRKKLYEAFPFETEVNLININCLLNNKAAEVYFSTLDKNLEEMLLLRYEIIL